MTTTDTRPRDRQRRSGFHTVNVGHLVMGIAFAGIVVIWILVKSDAVTGSDIRWLLPVPWVLAGLAGLIATTRRRRDSEEWREAAYDAHERGWVGTDEPREQYRPEQQGPGPAYDDLDEKLARAEWETESRHVPSAADPQDPADPADLADPMDHTDEKENDR